MMAGSETMYERSKSFRPSARVCQLTIYPLSNNPFEFTFTLGLVEERPSVSEAFPNVSIIPRTFIDEKG
jgi:hypothetical protein